MPTSQIGMWKSLQLLRDNAVWHFILTRFQMIYKIKQTRDVAQKEVNNSNNNFIFLVGKP